MFLIADKELPIKPTKKWPHMDRVEPEKLEWMKDLPPPPKADNLTVRYCELLVTE